MKQFKTLLFAAALFIGMTSFVQAQSKVAHINTQELIQAMPLQNKMKQYQAEVETKTEEENIKRAEEVRGLEENIRKYQANAQQDLQKKEFELLKPITEKAKAAIDKVAKAQGYNYVLDAATLIVADGKDLMADVKRELGI